MVGERGIFLKFEKWTIGSPNPDAEKKLRDAGYPGLLARVLAVREIETPEEAENLLRREERLSISPMLMKDMDKAVERVKQAIANKETIAIFGDYDVDGITSTILLKDYLTRQGVECLRYIPRRVEDGYGLSKDAVRGLREQGASLMITVDCGVTGNEEAAYAKSLGLDVVITDHHACKGELPDAIAVVDPHRPDCEYPFKSLAGCGVALKLVLALGGEEQADELFKRYCTLATLGTIADVMRMTGENRIIVTEGLKLIRETPFIGLKALLKEIGLWDKEITSTKIGFVVSPRLNAAGRMGDADLAADLLETRDPARAEELAKRLCDLNHERQRVEQGIFSDAESKISQLPPDLKNALVLASDTWHQGVLGIVAARLCEQYGCPTFMIDLRGESGKGSCRTVGGLNLLSALEYCGDLLESYGGHALAAGFTIKRVKIDAFRARMNAFVSDFFGGSRPVSTLAIDAAAPPEDLNLEQTDALEALEPYGSGNLRPVFALIGVTAKNVQDVGQGKHLKLRLAEKSYLFDAIFFGVTEKTSGIHNDTRVDAAFHVQPNTFRDTTSLQLQLLDIRPSLTPSNRELKDREIIRRLIAGESLSKSEVNRMMTTRGQFAGCWRGLDRNISKKRGGERDIYPWLRALAESMGGAESFLRTCLALEIFRERGLIEIQEREDNKIFIKKLSKSVKVVLEESPYLQRLKLLKKAK